MFSKDDEEMLNEMNSNINAIKDFTIGRNAYDHKVVRICQEIRKIRDFECAKGTYDELCQRITDCSYCDKPEKILAGIDDPKALGTLGVVKSRALNSLYRNLSVEVMKHYGF